MSAVVGRIGIVLQGSSGMLKRQLVCVYQWYVLGHDAYIMAHHGAMV